MIVYTCEICRLFYGKALRKQRSRSQVFIDHIWIKQDAGQTKPKIQTIVQTQTQMHTQITVKKSWSNKKKKKKKNKKKQINEQPEQTATTVVTVFFSIHCRFNFKATDLICMLHCAHTHTYTDISFATCYSATIYVICNPKHYLMTTFHIWVSIRWPKKKIK